MAITGSRPERVCRNGRLRDAAALGIAFAKLRIIDLWTAFGPKSLPARRRTNGLQPRYSFIRSIFQVVALKIPASKHSRHEGQAPGPTQASLGPKHRVES